MPLSKENKTALEKLVKDQINYNSPGQSSLTHNYRADRNSIIPQILKDAAFGDKNLKNSDRNLYDVKILLQVIQRHDIESEGKGSESKEHAKVERTKAFKSIADKMGISIDGKSTSKPCPSFEADGFVVLGAASKGAATSTR